MARDDADNAENQVPVDDVTAEARDDASGQAAKDDGGGEAGETARKIQQAVAEALAEQQDSVLRAQAEVQNMRRRCEQDVEKAHKFALERFSAELLTVIDNLERALLAVPDSDHDSVKALYEGVELTLKGFLEVMNKHQIEQIDPAGEPFDPQVHQAMSMVENDDVEPNTVLTVVQKGYLLNGRVIRPAMVMVAKASSG